MTMQESAGRLHVGVQLPEVERSVPWIEYRAMARAAEEVGFDSVWVGDHSSTAVTAARSVVRGTAGAS